MGLSILAGATSQSIPVFVQDSSKTTGAGLTGLVYNTAGLIAYYTFAGANAGSVQIVLATLAAVNSAWSSGGFKEIDATNMPGWYRLDLPNAALASGKGRCVGVHLQGATNMAPCPVLIELTGWDNQDGVHGGMSALPNVASGAAGAIPTTGTGANQISVSSGQVILQAGTGTGQLDFTSGVVKANVVQVVGNVQTVDANGLLKVDVEDFGGAAGTFAGGRPEVNTVKWVGGTIPAVNVTGVPLVDLKYTLGTLSPAAAGSVSPDWAQVANKGSTVNLSATTINLVNTLTTYTGNTVQTGDAYARLGAPAGASIAADLAEIEAETDGIAAIPTTPLLAANVPANFAALLISAGGHISNVDTLTTYTGNTVQTGDAYARLGAPAGASIAADLAEIEGETDTLLGGVTLLASGLDGVVVETGLNARQALAIMAAALAGVLSGAATTDVKILGAGVATQRIEATVDAAGDRTVVTLSPPA